MLVEIWLTSSVKDSESALILGRYSVHGAFLEFMCSNWCSYRLEMALSRNLCSCPKEAKPIVLYDVEWGIALKPMPGNWSSLHVDLGYTELFHIPVVMSVSF